MPCWNLFCFCFQPSWAATLPCVVSALSLWFPQHCFGFEPLVSPKLCQCWASSIYYVVSMTSLQFPKCFSVEPPFSPTSQCQVSSFPKVASSTSYVVSVFSLCYAQYCFNVELLVSQILFQCWTFSFPNTVAVLSLQFPWHCLSIEPPVSPMMFQCSASGIPSIVSVLSLWYPQCCFSVEPPVSPTLFQCWVSSISYVVSVLGL